MENQENCVTIVNNVIAKIKEISKKVNNNENNEDIDVLGNAVNDLISNHEEALKDKGTENGVLNNQIKDLEEKLQLEKDKVTDCATQLEQLKAENLEAQIKAAAEMDKMRKEADEAVKNKNKAMEDAKKATNSATEANEKARAALEEAKANRLQAQKDAEEKEAALDKSSFSEGEKEKAQKEAEAAKTKAIQAAEDAAAAIKDADDAAAKLAAAKENAYTTSLDTLKQKITSLEGQIENAQNLNTLKNEQINAQNAELSSKDSELFAMKGKNLELMKQYYGKHLAFKEIFTELNNKVTTDNQESTQPTKLTTMDLSNIKDRIVKKQGNIDITYSTEQLNSLKDIKDRINAINKRIQVLKEAKTSEPQTEEVSERVTEGGKGENNQEELATIESIEQLENMLKIEETKFTELNNNINNDIDLLKPDPSGNLNELTKQHWESKDDYGDITEFAKNMIEMYNGSVEKLNGSIAENESLKTSSTQSDGELREKIKTLDNKIIIMTSDLESKNNDLNSKKKELDLANTKHTETIKAINSMLELKLDYYNLNEDVDTDKVDQDLLEKQIAKFNKDVEIINASAKTTIPDYEAVDQPVIDKLRNKLIELNEIRKKFDEKAILNKEQREELQSYEEKINKFVEVMFGDGKDNKGFLTGIIEKQAKIFEHLGKLAKWQNQSIKLLKGENINGQIEPPNLSLFDYELIFKEDKNIFDNEAMINESQKTETGIQIGIYAIYSAIKSFTNVVFKREVNSTIEQNFKFELYQKTNFNLKDLANAIKTTHEKLTERNTDLGIFNQRKGEINKKILDLTEQMIECSKKDTSFQSVGSSLQTALNIINNNNKKLNVDRTPLEKIQEYPDGGSKQGGKLKRSLNLNTKIKRSLKKRK
tara:strand:- start:3194 stop:5833 length:2640 start_codon:yes stop_codon:yes gene_type:complete